MVYKVDLHNHTSTFPKILGRKIDEGVYVKNILEDLFKKEGTLVLGIADFDYDTRYNKFLHTVKKLSYTLDTRYKEYFFSVQKGKKNIYFVHTHEIETEKGHILLVGFHGRITKNLKELLKEARRQKALIIANHTLHNFPFTHIVVLRLLGKSERAMSMDAQTLSNNHFDALELNPYFPEDWKKIKKMAKKEKTSLTTNSDAHFLQELFRSYLLVEHLDFHTPHTFTRSLRRALKKHLPLHARKAGYISLYKHGLQIVLEIIGRKLGIIKDS